MNVNILILSSSPFFDAYLHSDFMGKAIFIGLISLSISCWTVLIYKIWQLYQARRNATLFSALFQQKKQTPLNLTQQQTKSPNPFGDLYTILKRETMEILNKNQMFGSYLSPADIGLIQNHLISGISSQVKQLEQHLFILSTVVSLGPFLGLLGTVWGILTTFSQMQLQASSSSQMIIGGLSLALATTVLGLLDAIPALIGYNYLKDRIRDLETDMESFSTEILASIELQYRQVDLKPEKAS